MDLLRTDVDTQVERRVKALQKAGHSEELQQSGEMDELMGRTRDLWERKEDCKTRITPLKAQKQELEDQRAQGANERSKLVPESASCNKSANGSTKNEKPSSNR